MFCEQNCSTQLLLQSTLVLRVVTWASTSSNFPPLQLLLTQYKPIVASFVVRFLVVIVFSTKSAFVIKMIAILLKTVNFVMLFDNNLCNNQLVAVTVDQFDAKNTFIVPSKWRDEQVWVFKCSRLTFKAKSKEVIFW